MSDNSQGAVEVFLGILGGVAEGWELILCLMFRINVQCLNSSFEGLRPGNTWRKKKINYLNCH